MIIRVNDVVLDTEWLRCDRTTQEGNQCHINAGDKGIVEVATNASGDIKLDVTCGTHVNQMAGNDVRFKVRMDAIASSRLANTANTY